MRFPSRAKTLRQKDHEEVGPMYPTVTDQHVCVNDTNLSQLTISVAYFRKRVVVVDKRVLSKPWSKITLISVVGRGIFNLSIRLRWSRAT
ncbi:hypothetical protein Ct61P_00249 [Colletotrichum tofieldiae]|nr:hypothetical protein Ct61P_00249 [Colletotrichum tofieldiae]